jgi:putative solute:sodium symporter small subunit
MLDILFSLLVNVVLSGLTTLFPACRTLKYYDNRLLRNARALPLLPCPDCGLLDAVSQGGGPTTQSGGICMDDLTDEQRRAYWRYNITLTTILLIIWFVAAYIISGLLAGWLNQYTFLGFPLGYYMAAQGSLAIFVLEIAVYAYLMNRLDLRYGIREE